MTYVLHIAVEVLGLASLAGPGTPPSSGLAGGLIAVPAWVVVLLCALIVVGAVLAVALWRRAKRGPKG
jgi:hypothetical protein